MNKRISLRMNNIYPDTKIIFVEIDFIQMVAVVNAAQGVFASLAGLMEYFVFFIHKSTENIFL